MLGRFASAHKKALIVSQGLMLMAVYCATALAHHGCGLLRIYQGLRKSIDGNRMDQSNPHA